MTYSPTVLGLLVTVCLLVGLAAVAWRYRTKPGAKLFGFLQALSAVWAGLTVVGLTLPPGPARLRVWGLTTGTSLLVAVFWFGFILSYTGRDHWLTVRRFGVASVPLTVGAGLYFVAPGWQLLAGRLAQETTAAGTLVLSSIGPVGVVLGVYVYAVFFAGLVLVVRTVLERADLFAGQALAFALGSMVTIVASFLVIVGIPREGYPLTQVALGGQSLLWAYAVFGQQFIQVVPAVAAVGERAVFDDLDDGVVVVDDGGTVTRANPRARSYFGVDDPVGGSVESLLDRMDVSSLADLPTRFRREGRTYKTKASAITNWRGDAIGHALVVQDVTPLVRRQQRLQVLNRILRHNVRNDMNVVLGIGTQLQDRGDDGLATMGERLDRTADSLTAISEKAIEIDRIFEEPGTAEYVDLPDLVDDVVSRLAARYPDATVETAVGPDGMWTDARTLSCVLDEVVENALEHAGEAPEVAVEVARVDDGVRVAVADDGPGIPRAEVAPILAGEETALEHASSLGLWLVYWGTQSLGGDLDVDTSETGSTVTLTLPDRTGSDTAAAPERHGDRARGRRPG